jgi:hypothetical protein
LDPANKEKIKLSWLENHLDAVGFRYNRYNLPFVTIEEEKEEVSLVRDYLRKCREELPIFDQEPLCSEISLFDTTYSQQCEIGRSSLSIVYCYSDDSNN